MTKVTKPHEVQREWHLIDAEGKTFGRILTEVATLLRGKQMRKSTLHTLDTSVLPRAKNWVICLKTILKNSTNLL